MGNTFSVRVAASIAKRGEGATRRRAGLTFGAGETIVSTDKDREGATHVTKKQLKQILEDSNLRVGDAQYPEPGLRVKEVAVVEKQEEGDELPPEDTGQGKEVPAVDATVGNESEVEGVVLDDALRADPEPERRPGRPRKAAKE